YQNLEKNSQNLDKNYQNLEKNSQNLDKNYQNLEKTTQDIAEAFQLSKENEQRIKEMAAENDRRAAENDRRAAENDRRAAENDKMIAENKQKFAEMRAESRKTDRQLNKLGRLLGGISNSNGEMAENYFYYAFKADKTFANEKFDEIARNLAFKSKDKSAEFDLVLFNGKSAAIIEVKYNAKPENISVEKLISRVEIFKILCPNYKNHKIYLGVAAMSFKEGLETELHQAGIATVRQIGKKMVRFDKDVKVF
ncbi:MAG: hypothetical protein FWF65_07915, partial [Bacteroidetes bacterium]|nr:hypothetical protein [Bacteroidota bacterium]